MWFSALKGPYLTLGQIDKTLPVDVSKADNKKIKRGSFVYVTPGDNEVAQFALYTGTVAEEPSAVPYIALMGVNDWQAGMAGNIGQAETVGNKKTTLTGNSAAFLDAHQIEGSQGFRGPRITAISCLQAGEYQTTAFQDGVQYYIGCALTVNDEGMLTLFEDGKNIVGYCTAVPTKRYINDLGADDPTNRITGGNADVISFTTAWIPASKKETGDVTGSSVGKPVVTAAAAGAAKGAAPTGAAKPAGQTK